MFYSQCLMSRRGSLRAIWIAAYCFKKLKKSQVTQTDISFSVDKILREEWDMIAYRVLAYLLLGIVRIYSKKVEYLFKDCNGVLAKLNNFVVSTKGSSEMETMRGMPFYLITVPQTFELDAFDLEILEDVGEGNMVSHEEISLKETFHGNEVIGHYSLDWPHCEETDDAFHNNWNFDDNSTEEYFSSHCMDIDMEASTSYNLTTPEQLQIDGSSRKECSGLELVPSVDKEPLPLVEQSGGIYQPESTEKHQSDMSCQEVNINTETCSLKEREDEVHQTEVASIVVKEMVQPENENLQLIDEEHNLGNLESSVEILRDHTSNQGECMVFDVSYGPVDSIDFVLPFSHEHHNDPEELKFFEMTLLQRKHPDVSDDPEESIFSERTLSKRKHLDVSEDPQLSISFHGTPQSMLPDTSGKMMLEFMAIPTPAAQERPKLSRKRKCIIDDLIVLPNEIVRKSIHDARDLVSKRRKAPHTVLAAWKARIPANLSHWFSESPLLSCVSEELRSLFRMTGQNIIESLEIDEFSEKFHVPSPPPTFDGSNQITPETHGRTEEFLENLNRSESSSVNRSEQMKSLGNLDVPEPLNFARNDQVEIAPETPVRCSTTKRSLMSPESPKISDADIRRPASSLKRVDIEPHISKDLELDLGLLIEVISSCEGNDSELDGWSARTKMASRFLHMNFLSQKKQTEEETINLSQVLEGRARKESARLFYELLVLKSKGLVDVKQEYAFGDILVHKLLKWDHIFGSVVCKTIVNSE